MGKQESEPPTVFCPGELCNRWFCQAHFGDPNWHSCAEERKSRIRTVTT